MLFRAIACLWLLVSISYGLSFEEDLSVHDNGKIFAQTDTGFTKDQVQGIGEQTYYRKYTHYPNEESLQSEYTLANSSYIYLYNGKKSYSFKVLGTNSNVKDDFNHLNFSPNRYAISMKSPTGLQHALSVRGRTGIGNILNIKNSIEFKVPQLGTSASENAKPEFKTDYNIKGAGDLSEAVLNYNVLKHREVIGEMSVSSKNFSLTSRLSDTLFGFGDYDPSGLSSMADVNITSEYGKEDPIRGLRDNFEKGFVSIKTYEHILEEYWKDGILDEDSFLSEAHSLLENRKITKEEYDKLELEVRSKLVEEASVTTNLSDYTKEFLSDRMNKTTYLILIDNMWKNKDLGDDQYLEQLMDLKNKGKISETDYSERSTAVQNRIMSEVTE